MPEPKFDIPNIPIKIRREGEKLKIVIGNATLKAKAIGNQEYDLVTIEQFITNSSKIMYQNIIQQAQVISDLGAAAEWDKKHATNSKTTNRVKDTLSPGE